MPNRESETRASDFDFAPPPPEWTEEYRRMNFALVANATLSEPAEPTQQQREHAAMAATILHLGARIEILERRLAGEADHAE